jgi:hypothetical protein
MAVYRAISDGNWSNLAIWEDNSTSSFIPSTQLPGVNDDVYPNGFIVQLNQTISVKSLRAAPITGVVVGGRFELSDSYNITTTDGIFTRTVNGAANVITDATVYIKSPVTTVINSNINGSGNTGRCVVTCDSTSHITINGNLTCAAGASAYCLWVQADNSTIIINGNLFGGSGASGISVRTTQLDNNITINGNLTGGTGTLSRALLVQNNGNGNITITGNLRGGGGSGTGNGAEIITNGLINITGNILSSPSTGLAHTLLIGVGNPIVTILGNIEGGSAALGNNGVNIVSTNTGSITIIGNITAQTGAAINNLSTNTQLFINGNVFASSANAGVINQSLMYFDGNATNVLSYMAINSLRMVWEIDSNSFWKFLAHNSSTEKFLYGAGFNTGHPNESDTREGVIYGPNNELEGELIVPDPSNVRKGVPTDNTVGTADLTAQDFLDALTNSPDDIAVRLRNVATVQTTGDQIQNLI